MYPVDKRGAQETREDKRQRTGILIGLDLFLVGGRLSLQDQWVHQPCHLILSFAARYTETATVGRMEGTTRMNWMSGLTGGVARGKEKEKAE